MIDAELSDEQARSLIYELWLEDKLKKIDRERKEHYRDSSYRIP